MEDVSGAVITAVHKDGADLVLTLQGLRRRGTRARASLVFTNATHVDAQDVRSDLANPELSAGYEIENLQLSSGSAKLYATRTDMHDTYPAIFTITCSGAQLSPKTHWQDTARAWLRKAEKF